MKMEKTVFQNVSI